METKKERFIRAWKTVFEVDEVKDDDNFFEVGGDSMKGVQLISALAGCGLKLDMLKLYTQPTVEELVEAAEEMEPVEIPAEMLNGSLSGKDLEKYLADPTVRKAMAEFGVKAEDIKDSACADTEGPGAEEPKAAAGAAPFVAVQPGAIPVQGGYLIPVPVVYYFVPSGPDGAPAPPPEAVPVPVTAYPAVLQWPYGTVRCPENTKPDKKEE